MLYPISYSVPEEIIVPYVPFKTIHTAQHDYQFTNQKPYMENYRKAIFGITHLKCGWDAFRHYEILSQGTIPFFEELHKCPKQTLHSFPKDQVLMLMDKYGSLSFEDILRTSSSTLYGDIDDLLRYTREKLVTQKSAEYILSKTPMPTTKRVLFLHNTDAKGNYLCEMTAHGLIHLTDGQVDIFPEMDDLYDSYPPEEALKLYGKGFNYSRLIPGRKRKNLTEDAIWDKLSHGEYDHIINYAECITDKQLPFLHGDRSYRHLYDHTAISFICGRDCDPYWSPELNWYIRMNHDCRMKAMANMFNVFIRELGD